MKYVWIGITVFIFLGLYLPTNTYKVWREDNGIKTSESKEIAEKTLESEVERLSLKYGFSTSSVMAVIKCESQMYGGAENKNIDKDGNVWSIDKGFLQINSYYHTDTMKSLGLDINNKWDSLEYGFMLMKEQGLSPWKASRSCWLSKV
jgi:hypothetical protein